MTPPVFSVCVIFLLLETFAHLTALTPSSSLRFESVHVGEAVTLECFSQDSVAVMFYWYKQTLSQKPQQVSEFYKHERKGTLKDEFEKDPRFKLETSTDENHLKISNVQMSDSATYYCVSGYSFVFEFLEGIIIQVEDSGLNIKLSAHQSASRSIQPGGSVTLNCTVHTGNCDGEHSVYWFKDSEESHPGLIYTDGGSNDQCERKPDTQTHICVYNLQLKSLNLSHAGIYYCAVASCGRILFGNGTKLNFEDGVDSLVLLRVLSGALAFNTLLVVFLSYTAYKMYKTKSFKCLDPQQRSPAPSAPNEEDYPDEANLHYAALRENKFTGSRRQTDETFNECVYSGIRQ
ncbi:uncharacterized protein [Embiotoca jacksoni]|uniref:uncharacterized protein n=1 Tax=Embiotoca jacksoni TaxID=100190 RepID=UPI003703E5CB